MSEDSLRVHARSILEAALRAVDPRRAVRRALRLEGSRLEAGGRVWDLDAFRRVIAVGAGKAGAAMAQALEEILGPRLSAGVVVVKDGHTAPTRLVEVLEASHPVPDRRGVLAGQRLSELLREARADTLVFCLLSGGGSALLSSPAQGVSLADKQETTRLLLASGADIGEINAVRKHLSRLKGGGLALLASPAPVISLIVSDVVGDRLDVIASGPTVPDPSSWREVFDILERRGLLDEVPAPVRRHLEQGLAGGQPDTPKPGDPRLAEVVNLVVAGNRQALMAARGQARQLGYQTLVLSSTIQGETKDVGRLHAALACEVLASANPLAPPCCLISGGETTVTLGREPGQGGRNQEFALAAALDIQGLKGALVLSAGTDGTDGPTDAAGAQADGTSVARARALGLEARDHLRRHDAYPFFQGLQDLVMTGPTLTNVMDLHLVLVERAS